MPRKKLSLMKIVIVDPIFKASRLYYSKLAAQAANRLGYKPTILARNFSKTNHYFETMKDIDHDLFETCELPEDFWYGKIDSEQTFSLLEKIDSLSRDNDLIVYFSGLNELWPTFLDVAEEHFSHLTNVNMIFVEYHPEYLLNVRKRVWAKGLTGKIKQYMRLLKHKRKIATRITKFSKIFTNFKLIILDERVKSKKYSDIPVPLRNNIIINCDPAPFSHSDIGSAQTDNIVILSVGTQSRRKGLVQLIRLAELETIKALPVTIKIVGRLDKDTSFLKKRIAKADNINFHEGYFSDADISEFYQNSDYIILPYARSFTSSSGVLANAVAANRPVLSSDHGLVGHRVAENNLGYTFPFESIPVLEENIIRLVRDFTTDKKDYTQFQRSSEKFLKTMSEETHVNTLIETFKNSGA